MAASTDFFERRNPQAVLKHGILTRYAVYFAGRAGRATAGRVAFIDGYAGEGRYADDSPGSPLLLASQAQRAKSFQRNVKLAFIEQDAGRMRQLAASLTAAGVEPDLLESKPFAEVAEGVLDRYRGHAVFLFVDPFGLAISRATLDAILRRSSRTQPIDVLYHFSLSTVRRMGPVGIDPERDVTGCGQQLDRALGNIDWRSPFQGPLGPGDPTDAALEVARRFGASVAQASGKKVTAIPVRARPNHLPSYLLMLMSFDEQAHWDFADLASSAHEEWLLQCDTDDYEANVRADEESGVMQLFGPEPPSREAISARIKADAATALAGNIESLLRAGGSVRPMDEIEKLYGDLLGIARVTHVRAALRDLYRRGVIDEDARGDDFHKRSYQRAAPTNEPVYRD